MKELILLPLLFLSFAQAETIQCQVTEVIDGNNIACEKDNKEKIKVKLYGIDAPSLNQPYGQMAKEKLKETLNANNNIQIDIMDTNFVGIVYQYRPASCPKSPIIGSCMVRENINLLMLQKGCAWYVQFFEENFEYQQAQEDAKKAKHGLWADSNPIPPWVWRNMTIQKSK